MHAHPLGLGRDGRLRAYMPHWPAVEQACCDAHPGWVLEIMP